MTWQPVFERVKRVPRGRVVTYGQLARALKLPGGARTAGRAMGACPQGQGIPWHRVVGAGGRILLREPIASLQRKLLASEGVRFRGSIPGDTPAGTPKGTPGTTVDISLHGWEFPSARRGRTIEPRKSKPKAKLPRPHRQK